MTTIAAIRETFSCLIDAVADFAFILRGRFGSLRTVRIIEVRDGQFVLEENQEGGSSETKRMQIADRQIDNASSSAVEAALSGSQIELVLRSDRFVFLPLELPVRATEFIPGIVRSQIDRLTPWSASDAAFGWSKPIEAGAEKMVITIAATTLALIKPYVNAIANIGAQSIAVFTDPGEADPVAIPIKVWEERGRGSKDIGRIRQALIRVLAAAVIVTGVVLGADAIVGASLTAQQEELARQISGARTAAGAGRNAVLNSVPAVKMVLERRKYDAPLTVLVLESLSKILPDNTYVTELRIEGNKLRLTGVTQNAPSLIGLIEQSGRFTKATFFAPTTRSSSSSAELFNIEAVIQPYGPSS